MLCAAQSIAMNGSRIIPSTSIGSAIMSSLPPSSLEYFACAIATSGQSGSRAQAFRLRPRALEDLENDPQVRHLQVFYELEHPKHGKIKAAHRPVRVDSDRTIDFRPPPSLGEHSDEILSEAGVSADRIARLRASGII